MTRLVRHARAAAVGIAALAASLLAATRPGDLLDHVLYDALSALSASGQAPRGVLVVGIDEPSFAELGLQWPWPRALHAQLIDRLFARGVRAVALDIVFPEPSTAYDDAALAAAVRRHPRLILGADVNVLELASHRLRTTVTPAPALHVPATRVGAITLPVDGDGFVRAVSRVDADLPPLSLLAARAADPACCTAFAHVLERGNAYVPFDTAPGELAYVSYYQALSREALVPDERFAGRIAFVGIATQSASAPGAARPEFFAVPPTRWGAPLVAGVEIHARAAAAAMAGTQVTRLADAWSLGGGLLAALLLGLALRGGTAGRCLLIGAAVLGAGLAACYASLALAAVHVAGNHLFLPVIAVTAVNALHHYYETAAQKRFIQRAFSSYASPQLVEVLIREPARLQLGGASAQASVLFVDIAGFTTLSENHTPEQLVELMNHILDEITAAVLAQDGMVDKFIGDAVMAVWGVPLEQPDHALRACRAALAIRAVIERYARGESRALGTSIDARIGINSGRVVAGNIGGRERFDYTVLGNEVNLASRIEGVNKFYGTRVLIGENTRALVAEHMTLRHVDDVRVKGKTHAVGVYELRGEGAADARTARLDALYAQGFAHYRAQRWDDAAQHFEAVLAQRADDGPAATMLARCRDYAVSPPAHWDGAFALDSK